MSGVLFVVDLTGSSAGVGFNSPVSSCFFFLWNFKCFVKVVLDGILYVTE